MSERVREYRRLLTEWQNVRNAAGGILSDDEEEDWMTRCHDVWVKMTEEEAEEVDPKNPAPGGPPMTAPKPKTGCTLPHDGWTCSKDAGHAGHCEPPVIPKPASSAEPSKKQCTVCGRWSGHCGCVVPKATQSFAGWVRGRGQAGYERVHRACLGFHRKEVENGIQWHAQPAIPFRADGLLLFGVTDESRIVRCQIGHTIYLMASQDPIPARTFAAGYSFEEFLKLMENGDAVVGDERIVYFLGGKLLDIPRHFPFHRVMEKSISLAEEFVFEVEGPIQSAVLWGWGVYT